MAMTYLKCPQECGEQYSNPTTNGGPRPAVTRFLTQRNFTASNGGRLHMPIDYELQPLQAAQRLATAAA